jgi:ribosomal protein S18 acetylase RimI-like enzyme
MDSTIDIIPIDESHIAQVASWFEAVPFAGLRDSAGWVAVQHNEPIAVATLSYDADHVAILNFVVHPSERRHGVGEQLVRTVLAEPDVRSVSRLHAYVELDNVPAQKILDHAGFSHIGNSPDGRLVYEKH